MLVIDERIESNFESVHQFVLNAAKVIRKIKIVNIDEIIFKINVMLREVLNNAVEHGNKFDEEKFVFCKIEFENDKFIFIIEDEGSGFEVDEFYSLQGDFTMKHRSRGLDLIEKYGFKYKFNKNKIIVEYILGEEM